MSMLQIGYALYWASAVYDRYNVVAQMFLPLSLVLWMVVFAFTGSSAARHRGSGALAGLWGGLSGGVFSAGGLLLSFRIVYPVFMAGFLADRSVVVLMSLILLLTLVVLGILFGALGGFHK